MSQFGLAGALSNVGIGFSTWLKAIFFHSNVWRVDRAMSALETLMESLNEDTKESKKHKFINRNR